MKIGILTFHQSVNNGAVMQAYSLSKRLQKEYPDDEVEIIDYRIPSADKSYSYRLLDYFKTSSFRALIKKSLVLALDPFLLKRMRHRTQVFRDCLYKLPLSPKTITDAEELNAYIGQSYDILIVGSDAVWNYEIRGFPNPYFPDPELKVKKFSYAASCYGMDYLKIPESEKHEICNILSDFDFIGVRDEATENFVKWSGCNVLPYHTCDPTAFLNVDDLPIDVDILKNKMSKRGFDFHKPTIGMMGTDKMLSMIRTLYGDKYQIVSLYNDVKGADVNLYDLEPYEWAYVFRYFRLTFTTFFHGTLLSLRNGAPLICIDLNTEFGKNHVPKTLDVLKRLGFEDWYFRTDYKGLNFDKIREKADILLNSQMKKEILEKMDKEADSFELFLKALDKEMLPKNPGGQ